MKKAAAILLLALFLITNSGMSVTMHWCGGRLADVSLFSTEKHNCPCGKKKMKPGCCKDRAVTLKANNELAKTNSLTVKIPTPKIEFSFTTVQRDINAAAQFQLAVVETYHPPPCYHTCAIYVRHRSFLI